MATVFFRGLVTEIISSTAVGLTAQRRRPAEYEALTSVDALKKFPQNTAVVKPMSDGAAKTVGNEIICYPFFSSHLSMPLKPGEEVWFVYEDPARQSQVGYWLSRVCGPRHTEDTNYTFFASAHHQSPTKPEPTLADKFSGEKPVEAVSTQIISPTADPNELTRLIEYAKDRHRFEAVPRYSKRPGDLVLQGSNNTLIMLGEVRGQYSDLAKSNSNDQDIIPNMGAIDIVVGRGARPVFGPTETMIEPHHVPTNDKRALERPTEGDADFKEDAARLYLVAGTTQVVKNHPDTLLDVTLPKDTGFTGYPASGKSNGSFAVLKADNLRLVARGARDIPAAKGFTGLFNGEKKDSGSIIIIKEPAFGKIDGASVILHQNGVAHIAGTEIRLMRYVSAGAKEPYVLLSALVSFLESILTDIQSFSTTLITHVTPGFGAPSPQIFTAATALAAAAGAKLIQLQTTPLGMGSTLIYGE